jgi:hypothetical protein
MAFDLQTVDPSSLLAGRSRALRGIGKKIGDVTLNGEDWRGKVTDALIAATLTRTIAGASTVEMTIDDGRGRVLTSPLLQQRYDVELDGLHFRFVGVSRQDAWSLILRHEDREVARLRTKAGPQKAFRDKLTRAEYALQLVRAVPGPPIPFFCPELHTKEPIAKSATGVRAGASKVGSIPPTSSSEPAPGKQQTGSVEVAASWYDLPGAGSCGDLQQNLDQAYAELGFGGGVGNAMGGLPCGKWLRLSRGGRSVLAKKCDTGSGGAGTAGKPRAVDVTRQVAEKLGLIAPGVGIITVEGLDPGTVVRGQGGESVTVGGGGSAVPAGAAGGGGGATSTTVTKTQRYAFERRPGETDWAAMVRLATEVKWDCFCANGVVYFIAETDLLASQVEMEVAPGIDLITFDWDMGKPVTELQIAGRARDWAAPPGCVAEVFDQGPADGRYIVSEIQNDLLTEGDAITATLKRPTKPLPEPAPQTTTKTLSTPGGAAGGGAVGVGSGGAAAMIRWAQSQVGTPEGAKEAGWAAALGYASSVPWCSIFIATGIKAVTSLPLPSNPAYSGTWEHWSGGRTVSIAERAAGDFLIFDWGDGGITDHISLNIGGGQMIGGNQAHGVGASGGGAVTREGIPVGNIVAVVRPNY